MTLVLGHCLNVGYFPPFPPPRSLAPKGREIELPEVLTDSDRGVRSRSPGNNGFFGRSEAPSQNLVPEKYLRNRRMLDVDLNFCKDIAWSFALQHDCTSETLKALT